MTNDILCQYASGPNQGKTAWISMSHQQRLAAVGSKTTDHSTTMPALLRRTSLSASELSTQNEEFLNSVELRCSLCNAEFSPLRRKNHCQSCAHAVCMACSKIHDVPPGGTISDCESDMEAEDEANESAKRRLSVCRITLCFRCELKRKLRKGEDRENQSARSNTNTIRRANATQTFEETKSHVDALANGSQGDGETQVSMEIRSPHHVAAKEPTVLLTRTPASVVGKSYVRTSDTSSEDKFDAELSAEELSAWLLPARAYEDDECEVHKRHRAFARRAFFVTIFSTFLVGIGYGLGAYFGGRKRSSKSKSR